MRRRAISSSARGFSPTASGGASPRSRCDRRAASVSLLADGAANGSGTSSARPTGRSSATRWPRAAAGPAQSRPASPTSASSSTTTSPSTGPSVMLGAERLAGAAPAGALAEPRPRLALRSAGRRIRSRPSSTRPTASTSRSGKTVAVGDIPAKNGFDLPRGAGNTVAKKRKAIIPDPRNDENLAVAQTHLALIRFHNRVVDRLPASVPPAQRFAQARELVTKHYQWMIRTDYLPRICAPGVVNDVFDNGRKAFEVGAHAHRRPDHADRVLGGRLPARARMIRRAYNWNGIFDDGAGIARAAVHVLGDRRGPRRRAAAAEQLDRRLPPALRLREAGRQRPRRAGRASSTARCASTPRS